MIIKIKIIVIIIITIIIIIIIIIINFICKAPRQATEARDNSGEKTGG